MTRDDAAVLDGLTTDAIPVPRTGGGIREVPWLEPGQFSRSTRPRSRYWDVENARWASRSPVPGPRRGN
jgi:hypothetical protein